MMSGQRKNTKRSSSTSSNRKVWILVGVAVALVALIVIRSGRHAEVTSERQAGVRRVDMLTSEEAARVARAFAPPAARSSYAGTVRADDGEPIAAALVCAVCAACDTASLPPSACTESAADGSYTLIAADVRAVVISAAASGHAVGYANQGLPVLWTGAPRPGLDISLQPGGARLTGVVVDALGGPVGNARVILERTEGAVRSIVETQADDEGRFAADTSQGFVSARAEADGYAPNSKVVVAPARDIELQLTPASLVRGHVVSAGTGEPVSGAEVRALPGGFAAVAPPAITDEEGGFTLHGLESGTYALSAAHPEWRGLSRSDVEVRLADVVEDVVLQVVPAVRVLGRVQIQDKGGEKPCPRGLVELVAGASEGADTTPMSVVGRGLLAQIEADGMVRFHGVAQGHYRVMVECQDHVLAAGPSELDVGDRALDVMWSVRRGLGMNVQVLDGAGQPVPFARLLLRGVLPDQPNVETARPLEADARGRCVLKSHLQAGRYTLEAQAELEAEPVHVELHDGAPPADVTLRLPGSASIVVSARDEAGAGVSGLQVSARAEPTAAGPGNSTPATSAAGAPRGLPVEAARAIEEGDGRYRIGPLRPGSYIVRVEDGTNPSLHADGPLRLTAGSHQVVTVQVERGGKVHGRVVDERGAPESHAWVSASPEGEELSFAARAQTTMFGPPPRVLTDADGSFVLAGLRRGARYALKVKQPYDNAVVVHDVSEGQEVRIVLPASAVVEGQLVDADGRPVHEGRVTVQHEETQTLRFGDVGRDGAFTIDRIPAGRVVIAAGDPALGFARGELSLRGGQRHTGLRLALAPLPEPAGATPAAPAAASAGAPATVERREQPAPEHSLGT